MRRYVVSILLLLAAAASHAQDLEPRLYANAPVGLNFLIGGYAYSAGGVSADPSVPLENANVDVHSAVLGYAHSFAAWGHSAKVDAVGTYSTLSGRADFAGQPRTRDITG